MNTKRKWRTVMSETTITTVALECLEDIINYQGFHGSRLQKGFSGERALQAWYLIKRLERESCLKA